MKSLNVKKVAAVAAGTALLAGAALAVSVPTDLTKDFFVDSNGNVNSQIIIGAHSLDGVAAGNLAAIIGSKAYTSTGTQTAETTATGTAKFTVAGGSSSTLPEANTFKEESAFGAIASGLTLGTNKGLVADKITYTPTGGSSTEYDYKEIIESGTPTFNYAESTDYAGRAFTANLGRQTGETANARLAYKFQFVDNFPSDGKLNQVVEIPFLGENYLLNKVDTTEIELVKGEEVVAGVGQPKDVTVGDDVVTVTVTTAGLDESGGNNIGTATVKVAKGGQEESVNLDTSSSQDATVLGTNVFLQRVAKSYVSGEGATATLRVGGAKVKLSQGDVFPLDNDWKVDINFDSSNDKITEIVLYYYPSNSITAEDQITSVNGPNNYFQYYYDGTQMSRGERETETLTVTANDDDDDAVDEITYSTNTYKEEYTTTLNDGTNQRAFFAYNSTGWIGSGNSTDILGYLPMKEEYTFFVNNVPVNIVSISATTNADNAKVKFKVPGEEPQSYSVSSYCPTYATANPVPCTIPSLTTSAGDLTFNWDWNATTDGTYINITSGADNEIDTVWGTLGYPAATNNITDDTLITTPLQYVNTNTYKFAYDDSSSSNTGINMTIGGVAKINMASSTINSNDENHMDAHAEVTSASTNSITLKGYEVAAKPRFALVKGEVETTATGESVVSLSAPGTVNSDVEMTELTCTADPVTYEAGITLGTVDKFVMSDDSNRTPTKNAIVIGGHMVNNLAKGYTESKLTAAGNSIIEKSGNTLYVAGYSKADTEAAVDVLINAIKAM